MARWSERGINNNNNNNNKSSADATVFQVNAVEAKRPLCTSTGILLQHSTQTFNRDIAVKGHSESTRNVQITRKYKKL
jgi:hypothetical protein